MAKTCGPCSACCKLLNIVELNKPPGIWCPHAAPGKGCTIYHNRPAEVCDAFKCSWLLDPNSGVEWRPDRCGFIVREVGNTLMLDVEPSRAENWRREPYYSQIKAWAQHAVARRGALTVTCNGMTTVVFPDAEIPIGRHNDQDTFEGRYEFSDGRRRTFVRITHVDGSHTDIGA